MPRQRENTVEDGRQTVRNRAGQALAEMVLVTPILILLVFGIIEFGLAFRTYQIVTNSAREGARVAVLPSTTDPDDIRDVVIDRLVSSGLPADEPEPLTIELRCNGEVGDVCESSGDEWQVEVGYCYRFFVLAPIVNPIAGGDCSAFGEVRLRTASAMRKE